jgi:metal-responsive CopG/Arc/MetJ family transcriptional regulator
VRTTVDLPERLLEEVQAASRAPTRREALVIALEDYLRRQRLRAVIDAAGTLDDDFAPLARDGVLTRHAPGHG